MRKVDDVVNLGAPFSGGVFSQISQSRNED